jgi:hypothetical protein
LRQTVQQSTRLTRAVQSRTGQSGTTLATGGLPEAGVLLDVSQTKHFANKIIRMMDDDRYGSDAEFTAPSASDSVKRRQTWFIHRPVRAFCRHRFGT